MVEKNEPADNLSTVELKESIIAKISEIHSDFNKLEKMDKADKDFHLGKIERDIKKVDNFVKQFDAIVNSLKAKGLASSFVDLLAKFKNDVFELRTKFKVVKESASSNDLKLGLIKNSEEENINLEEMNQAQVIQMGDEIQAKSKNEMLGIKRRLGETHQVADAIQVELKKHEERLTYVDDTLKKMDGTLKRIDRYFRYFSKQVMADKILICMIIVILLGIIGVFIYSFIAKKNTSVTDAISEIKNG